MRGMELAGTQVSVHEGLELGILLSGGVEQRYSDYLFEGGRGDVWLVSMWEPHLWRVTAPGTDQLAVVFLPEFLGDEATSTRGSGLLRPFASPPSERPMHPDPETREVVLALARELRDEIEQKPRGWETAVRLAVGRLLFEVSRNWEAPSRPSALPSSRASGLARIMPALEAIHARPAARVGLEQAAAACGLSAPHFSRVFGRITGLSFAKFRLRAHLAYAARLLLTTELPTDAVAAQAGFVDGSHLHRNFVRQYGSTPGRYRKQAG
jgi:AraC-like DNA-binding protein